MSRKIHVVIFFINIGFYHIARLRAAKQACAREGWELTAVQLTDNTLTHPWGNAYENINFPIKTLIRKEDEVNMVDGLPIISNAILKKLILSIEPDVIFVPGWSFDMSRKLISHSKKINIPTVVMSESKFDDAKRFWWKESIKSFFYIKHFSAALVGSDKHAQYVNSLGIPMFNIFRGYDVVDNDHFRLSAEFARNNEKETRTKYHKMPKKPYFIVVTRLMQRKNILRLIDAYNNYRIQFSDKSWDLVICGDGEEKEIINKKIYDYKLEDYIHLVGFLQYDEIGHWYGLASAFIHPALHEQWGLVVNEACASGLPILCSKTVGSSDDLVCNEENGFIFDPTDINEITNSLINIHRVGRVARLKMGKISQNLVDSCSPEKFGLGVVSSSKRACKIEEL